MANSVDPDQMIWVYTVCKSVSVPILRVITASLNALSKFIPEYILKLIFVIFQKKIRFDILCELSARQKSHNSQEMSSHVFSEK